MLDIYSFFEGDDMSLSDDDMDSWMSVAQRHANNESIPAGDVTGDYSGYLKWGAGNSDTPTNSLVNQPGGIHANVSSFMNPQQADSFGVSAPSSLGNSATQSISSPQTQPISEPQQPEQPSQPQQQPQSTQQQSQPQPQQQSQQQPVRQTAPQAPTRQPVVNSNPKNFRDAWEYEGHDKNSYAYTKNPGSVNLPSGSVTTPNTRLGGYEVSSANHTSTPGSTSGGPIAGAGRPSYIPPSVKSYRIIKP